MAGTALIAGVLSVSSDYRAKQFQNTAPKVEQSSGIMKVEPAQEPQGPLERKISEHLSKYGPWIGKVLDLDYADQSDKKAQLRYTARNINSMLSGRFPEETIPLMETDAVYINALDFLVLRANWKLFIDHEIGHAWTSDFDRMRIKIPGYSGPGIEKVFEAVDYRIGLEMRGPFLNAIGEMATLQGEIESSLKDWEIRTELAKVMVQGLEKRMNDPKSRPYINDFLKSMKRYNDYSAQMDGLRDRIKLTNQKTTAFAGIFEKNGKACASDITPVLDELRAIRQDLKKVEDRYTGSVKDFTRFNKNAGGYLGIRLSLETANASEKIRENYKNYIDGVARYVLNRKETFARMFSSLMTVHVGEECMDNFPLTQIELNLFGAMMQDGAPMFDQALAKYELALQMKSDGVDPAIIRKNLEFAQSFEYSGRTYAWKPLGSMIRGAIPEINGL